jgi:alpha-tubulin suppressor-like RCC1 family protein
MRFNVNAVAAIVMSSVLVACGGDGNGAGSNASPTVNKPPVAKADFFNAIQGTTIHLDVLLNDVDPELGVLSIKEATLKDTTLGTLSISNDKKTLNLTPKADFVGEILLHYTLVDDQNQQDIGQVVVNMKSLQSLSAKQDSNCMIDSAGLIKCWGVNDYGQLGDGTKVFKNTPVTVANISGAKHVAMGYNHACAITQTGEVSCWGDNNNGQLGDGTQTARLQATAVTGLAAKATQLALSYQSTCALLETGAVQCWGSNSQGELGLADNKIVRKTTPTAVTIGSNLKVKRVVAGKHHVCAISENNALFCWGANDNGQLGLNDKTTRYLPTAVNIAGSVQQVAAGFFHTCAASASGVYCWGLNNKGQLGNNSTVDASVPILVNGLANASSLALGKEHSCAVTNDNKIFCWGSRQAGQTGQAISATEDKTPIQISSLLGKRELSAGDFHTCSIEGVDSSLAVKCWGKNDLGQLGNGDNKDSATPVSVKLN